MTSTFDRNELEPWLAELCPSSAYGERHDFVPRAEGSCSTGVPGVREPMYVQSCRRCGGTLRRDMANPGRLVVQPGRRSHTLRRV